MKLIFVSLISLPLFFLSCKSDGNESQQVMDDKELWQKLEETNKILAEFEREDILDFITRRGWNMEETGSGLWIEIYQQGAGPKAVFGNTVTLDYSVKLLTGELIYSSNTDGELVFQVGRGGVEAGLEEAILLLRSGDKARLILPPHLAHGFHGDGERIPRRATIVYDINVMDIH